MIVVLTQFVSAVIITINSPANTTYGASVWFNVTLNESTDWCGYSLDGATNISMSNDTTTHFYAQNTTMIEGSHNVTFSCNNTAGDMNSTAITEYFTVDTTCPNATSYYQWDSNNNTVDFGLWTEGFVSVNWNLTDSTGINTSSCIIRVRNKNKRFLHGPFNVKIFVLMMLVLVAISLAMVHFFYKPLDLLWFIALHKLNLA